MFKFGLHNKNQLQIEKLRNLWGGYKVIALDLYDDLEEFPAQERLVFQERILARFSPMGGIFKYTHSSRFDDFDEISMSAIKKSFPDPEKISVHDVGVSDGRTAADFFKNLYGMFGEKLYFLASDNEPFAYMLKRKNRNVRVILNKKNEARQIVFPPFVLNLKEQESVTLYPINHLVRWLSWKFYCFPLIQDFAEGNQDIVKQKIDLVCSQCTLLRKGSSNFDFEEYDLLSAPKGKFDIIRIMNVLNLGYFSQSQLRVAIENALSALNPGGLLITGSNRESGTIVNGAIYKKENDSLRRLAVSGQGSQVDNLICGERLLNKP